MDKKYIYTIMLMDDCVYQPTIVGIMDSKERAEEVLARIKEKSDPDGLGHAHLYIEEHILNDVDEELLMYNNLQF